MDLFASPEVLGSLARTLRNRHEFAGRETDLFRILINIDDHRFNLLSNMKQRKEVINEAVLAFGDVNQPLGMLI